MEGPIVIGALEGWGVGDLDGEDVVGSLDGLADGLLVGSEGLFVGLLDGDTFMRYKRK